MVIFFPLTRLDPSLLNTCNRPSVCTGPYLNHCSSLTTEHREKKKKKSCPATECVFQSLTEAPETQEMPSLLNHLTGFGKSATVTEKL